MVRLKRKSEIKPGKDCMTIFGDDRTIDNDVHSINEFLLACARRPLCSHRVKAPAMVT
jgi:hypothetical protein